VPLHVEVVSPERILWSGEAKLVRARMVEEGDIAFMTGHAPFVGALDTCVALIEPVEGPDELVAIHGGFIELSNDRISLLSDVAELASQIDVRRAEEAKERAEAHMRNEHNSEVEGALRRAHVRIEAAGGLGRGVGH
jgi:F-type H+-transporting ATPase subunit epsilon